VLLPEMCCGDNLFDIRGTDLLQLTQQELCHHQFSAWKSCNLISERFTYNDSYETYCAENSIQVVAKLQTLKIAGGLSPQLAGAPIKY